ncbi:hypothetical protein EA187_00240 [Lujinxingia sediminis]|uniref:DUF2975 domain-containing protein n=1 Tax=Lujinxingia sediminis TaxID=2480984 RepID=A0ABY0CWU9_9DELT|nr:hypothetical protein [Lujinxingia sediminis]RVU47900.1 hypothetical protein EA187_00240 [Lujinxingia sediminis]
MGRRRASGAGRRNLLQTATFVAMMGLASPAWASGELDATSALVVRYTLIALGVAVLFGLGAKLALECARLVGWIHHDRVMRLRRGLRVSFGANFLLAAITPYLALNFALGSVLTFLCLAALMVAAWAFGASRQPEVEHAGGV